MHTLAAFVLALAVIIFVHEYGHYRMALFWRVRVIRFSIGFGQPLISWTRQQPNLDTSTLFTICAIPLGGFVKMEGHQDESQNFELTANSFDAQSTWARICIVCAGPLANIALAIFLYSCLNWLGNEQARPVLSSPAPGSLAQLAGITGGDEVLRVREEAGEWHEVASMAQLHWQLVSLRGSQDIELELQSALNGTVKYIDLPLRTIADLDPNLQVDRLGISGPQTKPFIRAVNPLSPAARAGLIAGDAIISVNSEPVLDSAHLIRLIRSLKGTQQWQVQHANGHRSLINIAPVMTDLNGQQTPVIGAVIGSKAESVWIQDGFLEGFQNALTHTWFQMRLTASSFMDLVTSANGWKQLSGPITIANAAGQTAEAGWWQYANFLALISLSIGLMNLLPIPLLDGGHLMYYLWELITGAKPSLLSLQRFQAFGLACVLLLMFLAFLNDFLRWFS